MANPENPPLFLGANPGAFTEVTLRDLFAGFIACGLEANSSFDRMAEATARHAYAGADAMLAEREKRED